LGLKAVDAVIRSKRPSVALFDISVLPSSMVELMRVSTLSGLLHDRSAVLDSFCMIARSTLPETDLGFSGSNGSTFFGATRQKRRNVSDTVRPLVFSNATASLSVR
jgi:hypothetical protein